MPPGLVAPSELHGALTQAEHPVLRRPWFQLHPCNTAPLLDSFRREGGWGGNYLLTWASLFGPAALLRVPPAAAAEFGAGNETVK